MKVGILTFPNSRSYGAALQMFALYHTCQNLGYDTEIINYYNLWMKQEKHVACGKGKNKAILWTKRMARDLLHAAMKVRFRLFENQMQKYPRRAFSDPQKLPALAKRYGAVICGSDQVWNPEITDEDLSYFLDFCGPTTSRISYAPSFGAETLPSTYEDAVCKELEKFDSLSVREKSGVRFIQKLTGLHADLVLDPSLLLDAQQWQYFEEVCPQAQGEYILYYTVHSSPTLWNHCVELAKKTNMKILRIGSNIISKQFTRMPGVEFVCDIGPAQWLYLVHNASYVVTNSFHGTAFAINYRKNFYVEFSTDANSRLINIVDLLGLEERVLKDGEKIIPSPTDYSRTLAVLPQLKAESKAFLEEALKCAIMKREEYHA